MVEQAIGILQKNFEHVSVGGSQSSAGYNCNTEKLHRKITERERSGHPSALQNWMINATQIQVFFRKVRGTSDQNDMVCELDDLI